jgi:3'-phosphoadenosine 5'-phosphosulfate sulfotransferase (PAPS reductase)/FAD synthetase
LKLEALRQKQSLPLEAKVAYTQRRIREFYDHFQGQVYVSFSGGKDSTVLLHLVRDLYPEVPAVFCDTGLEYPEIREFVKSTPNVEWLKPKTHFTDIINRWGYPVTNKEQAQFVWEYRNTKSERLKHIRWHGDEYGRNKIQDRWKVLRHAPFQVSHKCCDYMKKKPFHAYERVSKRVPFIGSMADESKIRLQQALRYETCNRFDATRPKSEPLTVWMTPDIWEYLKAMNVPYSPIYDMGYDRTGCMFCMFGVHMEKHPNRFQRMKETHPKLWDYCINKLDLKQVMDFIGIEYE